MKAIVSQGTDHTNVYGYVTVQVLDGGLVDTDAYENLPDSIRATCGEQHNMVGCSSINREEKDVVRTLENLGFEVLDCNADAHEYSSSAKDEEPKRFAKPLHRFTELDGDVQFWVAGLINSMASWSLTGDDAKAVIKAAEDKIREVRA